MAKVYLQHNQPDGVPPLQLTGERTLSDVPEENYWFRRHRAFRRGCASAAPSWRGSSSYEVNAHAAALQAYGGWARRRVDGRQVKRRFGPARLVPIALVDRAQIH